jgi:hypothetical protein
MNHAVHTSGGIFNLTLFFQERGYTALPLEGRD